MNMNTNEGIPQSQLYLDVDVQRQKIDALPEPTNAAVKQCPLVNVIEVPSTESAQQSLAMNGCRQKDMIYIVDYDVKAQEVNIIEPIVPFKKEAIINFSEDTIVDMPENTPLHTDMVEIAPTSEIAVTSDDNDDNVLCALDIPPSAASSFISRDSYNERSTLDIESVMEEEEAEEDSNCLHDPFIYRVLILYMIVIVIFAYAFKTFVIDLPMHNE